MFLTSWALIVAAASPRGAKAPPRRAAAATTAAAAVSSLTAKTRVDTRCALPGAKLRISLERIVGLTLTGTPSPAFVDDTTYCAIAKPRSTKCHTILALSFEQSYRLDVWLGGRAACRSTATSALLSALHSPGPLGRGAIGVTGAVGSPNKKGVLAGLHLVNGARAAGLPLLLVELAAEVRASLGGGKPESDLDHRLHCAHDLLRVLGDFRLRRASVDRERALGRARVDVSDLILGAYVEAVGAVGEPRVALW